MVDMIVQNVSFHGDHGHLLHPQRRRPRQSRSRPERQSYPTLGDKVTLPHRGRHRQAQRRRHRHAQPFSGVAAKMFKALADAQRQHPQMISTSARSRVAVIVDEAEIETRRPRRPHGLWPGRVSVQGSLRLRYLPVVVTGGNLFERSAHLCQHRRLGSAHIHRLIRIGGDVKQR
jgi:hypothetical protein